MLDQEPVSRHIRYLKALRFIVVASVHPARVEYQIFDVNTWNEDDEPVLASDDVVFNLDDPACMDGEAIYMHGSVKWDGCSNWMHDIESGGKHYLHGCSRDDIQRLGDVMGFCHDWTGELIPGWDGYDLSHTDGDKQDDNGLFTQVGGMDVPKNYRSPNFDELKKPGKLIHEWRAYVSEPLQGMWSTFTDRQRAAIAASCKSTASDEDWD